MIEIYETAAKDSHADMTLVLPFELRQKSRFRVTDNQSREFGFFLPSGTHLHGGDCVKDTQGNIITIESANETLSVASTGDALLHARACYHLGNRHVPLQILGTTIRYQPDHVLDEMVRQLGLEVSLAQAPFEPESGAYSGGHHHHG